jgi:hypothetical protein
MRSFIISILHQILLAWSNQEGWDGKGIWDRWEMHTKFWLATMNGRDQGTDGMDIKELGGRVWTRFVWSKIEPVAGNGNAPLGSINGGEISWLFECLIASQEITMFHAGS